MVKLRTMEEVVSIKKEHKAKINTAIDMCEARFEAFDGFVIANWGKEEAKSLRKFLLDNTVFAGGVFRSVFTKTPVNDFDIFFTSQDAAIEFQHRMMIHRKTLFPYNQISNNQTYKWWDNKAKKYTSFITEWANPPDKLLSSFDFSFNQHYFSLKDYRMQFDMDTFDKVGAYIANSRKSKHALRYYMRALRFQQEGLKLNRDSWYALAADIGDMNLHDVARICQENSSDGDGPKIKSPSLTGMRYTENDYFDVNKHAVKKKSYTVDPALEDMIRRQRERRLVEATLDPINVLTFDGAALNSAAHPAVNTTSNPAVSSDIIQEALEEVEWVNEEEDEQEW